MTAIDVIHSRRHFFPLFLRFWFSKPKHWVHYQNLVHVICDIDFCWFPWTLQSYIDTLHIMQCPFIVSSTRKKSKKRKSVRKILFINCKTTQRMVFLNIYFALMCTIFEDGKKEKKSEMSTGSILIVFTWKMYTIK